MTVRKLVQRALPTKAISPLSRARDGLKRARNASLPPLNEDSFAEILVTDLGLTSGDTVFVHSSIDQLHLDFPFYRVLSLLETIVGSSGTLLFPTYPRLSSFEFLVRDETFNVSKTPSYTGILTEFARRQPGAYRSFHPTKSVCAIGANARALTSTHQMSIYPYDENSPYYKIIELGGKIIGMGVSTSNLSFVHCVDDALKKAFPVQPYHSQIFSARCINSGGRVETVKTYAHDLAKMRHHIPRYMRTYVSREACADLKIKRRKFFRADAARLFEEMIQLAKRGITIYPPSAYSSGQV